MNREVFLNDWASFFEMIVCELNLGKKDEVAISSMVGNAKVIWQGVITELALDEEWASGVAVNMSPGRLAIDKDRVLRGAHLFLNVDSKTKGSWSKCKVGDKIKFSATITRTSPLFPSIRISEDDVDSEVLLMIGLNEGKCLLILNS